MWCKFCSENQFSLHCGGNFVMKIPTCVVKMSCKSDFLLQHGVNLTFHHGMVKILLFTTAWCKSDFSPQCGENLTFHHSVVKILLFTTVS